MDAAVAAVVAAVVLTVVVAVVVERCITRPRGQRCVLGHIKHIKQTQNIKHIQQCQIWTALMIFTKEIVPI